jgi:hypothetical protein
LLVALAGIAVALDRCSPAIRPQYASTLRSDCGKLKTSSTVLNPGQTDTPPAGGIPGKPDGWGDLSGFVQGGGGDFGKWWDGKWFQTVNRIMWCRLLTQNRISWRRNATADRKGILRPARALWCTTVSMGARKMNQTGRIAPEIRVTLSHMDKLLLPHQRRVLDERNELADRVDKLSSFVYGRIFNELEVAEKMRLIQQLGFMNAYLSILDLRIHAFWLLWRFSFRFIYSSRWNGAQ